MAILPRGFTDKDFAETIAYAKQVMSSNGTFETQTLLFAQALIAAEVRIEDLRGRLQNTLVRFKEASDEFYKYLEPGQGVLECQNAIIKAVCDDAQLSLPV